MTTAKTRPQKRTSRRNSRPSSLRRPRLPCSSKSPNSRTSWSTAAGIRKGRGFCGQGRPALRPGLHDQVRPEEGPQGALRFRRPPHVRLLLRRRSELLYGTRAAATNGNGRWPSPSPTGSRRPFSRTAAGAWRKEEPRSLDKAYLKKYREGLSAQIMHLGPYSEEAPTIQKLPGLLPGPGYTFAGPTMKSTWGIRGGRPPQSSRRSCASRCAKNNALDQAGDRVRKLSRSAGFKPSRVDQFAETHGEGRPSRPIQFDLRIQLADEKHHDLKTEAFDLGKIQTSGIRCRYRHPDFDQAVRRA